MAKKNTYLISYDLENGSSENYENINSTLENMGAIRILTTTWVVKKKDTSCKEIRDCIKGKIDTVGYRLIVCDIADWSGTRLLGKINEL